MKVASFSEHSTEPLSIAEIFEIIMWSITIRLKLVCGAVILLRMILEYSVIMEFDAASRFSPLSFANLSACIFLYIDLDFSTPIYQSLSIYR